MSPDTTDAPDVVYCADGCGEIVPQNPKGRPRKFLPGHATRFYNSQRGTTQVTDEDEQANPVDLLERLARVLPRALGALREERATTDPASVQARLADADARVRAALARASTAEQAAATLRDACDALVEEAEAKAADAEARAATAEAGWSDALQQVERYERAAQDARAEAESLRTQLVEVGNQLRDTVAARDRFGEMLATEQTVRREVERERDGWEDAAGRAQARADTFEAEAATAANDAHAARIALARAEEQRDSARGRVDSLEVALQDTAAELAEVRERAVRAETLQAQAEGHARDLAAQLAEAHDLAAQDGG